MTGFRRALIVSAFALSLGLPASLAIAQGDPQGAAQGQGYGRGYGPGMMGRGYGYGPGMMWGGGYGAGMMWGWGGWASDASTAESSAEGRLAFLKAELKITPSQESLWNAYANSVRESAKAMYERHKALFEGAQANEPLPQRLDRHEQIMALGLDALRKTDAVLTPLYAALDDHQKQLADRFLGISMMPFGGMF